MLTQLKNYLQCLLIGFHLIYISFILCLTLCPWLFPLIVQRTTVVCQSTLTIELIFQPCPELPSSHQDIWQQCAGILEVFACTVSPLYSLSPSLHCSLIVGSSCLLSSFLALTLVLRVSLCSRKLFLLYMYLQTVTCLSWLNSFLKHTSSATPLLCAWKKRIMLCVLN